MAPERFDPGEAASACRPFAIDRTGFVAGEGVADLVLESDARAQALNARAYTELAGSGIGSDTNHLAGAVEAILTALALQRRELPHNIDH